jgi:hypothetical protein
VLAIALVVLVSGCGYPERMPAVPQWATEAAFLPEIPEARYYADADDVAIPILAEGARSLEREAAALGYDDLLEADFPPASYLAVSGGGEDGAFGAGLLVGWTETGARPTFKMVTGISTGALTAPFAFLGPDYDDELEEVYTGITVDDVLEPRSVLAAVTQDALNDARPFQKTLARYVTAELLDAIAAEYEKGRLLFVATTNLDVRRQVLWNMTAIAASDATDKVELFQKILMASAAIPGVFPPVMIEVEVDGKRHQEMHVDGGAGAQIFAYPPQLRLAEVSEAGGLARERRLFLIRNARLDPDWAEVDRRTLDIVGRTIATLIQSQGVGDLYRIYIIATRDGIDYNLAFIPRTFDLPYEEPFDPAYMKPLFDLGRELGRAGYDWKKTPPGLDPSEEG